MISGVSYFLTYRKKTDEYLQLARFSFHGAAVTVFMSAALLLYFILTHQFQYSYVWNYSSTDLPLHLLISTFYAGQEGSFHLWALYTAIIGIVLMSYSQRRGWETEVMAVFSLVFTFLLGMLVVKNPYMYVWETFPKDLVHTGAISNTVENFVWLDQAKGIWAQFPSEGKGLNPLLQNYWMAIHPQILFAGFTSMSVPFIFAIAGLMRREYQSWIAIAKPWTVFGSAALGMGIILGGYWAYETLGWGGYWGWDPVENSSLIPWLICIASLHTIMSQRKMGTFVRTNFVLSILGFVLVLYSTFLTRSGVLGETSVHSFVDPGMWAYWILLIVMLLFAGIGFGLLIVRMKEMPKVPVEQSMFSREFAIFLGASALVIVAVVILVGTSSPIITNILSGKQSAVDISYYTKTTLPFGIVIALLMGIGQMLWWQNSHAKSFFENIRVSLLLTVLFTGSTIYLGVQDIAMIIFIFAASFALFVNLIVGFRVMKGSPKYAGGSVAHIGMALMFIGFVTSARYDDKQTVSLEEGKPVEVLNDYKLTYLGYQPIEREQFAFNVKIEKGTDADIISPVMYFSKFTEGLVRNPDILNKLTQDFYIAPLSLETSEEEKKSETVVFLKNETKEIEGMKVTFLDYNFNDEDKGKMVTGENGEVTIGVNLEIEKDGVKERVSPMMKMMAGGMGGNGPEFIPASFTGSSVEFRIGKIMPDRENKENSRVEIVVNNTASVSSEPKKDTLVVEASVKPFIILVWIGTAALFIGFMMTIIRRLEEAKLKSAE
jgi:cytochrome c-type biogenesis protein CcmF